MNTHEKAHYLASYFSQAWLAKKMQRSIPTIAKRLNGTTEWKIYERVFIDDLYDRTKCLEEYAKQNGAD